METNNHRPTHLAPPRCDGCGGPTELLPRTAYVRRGERVVAYPAWSWACAACSDPFTGQRPYRFSDRALGTWNEGEAAAAWQERFQEPIPPSERRKAAPREVRVPVLLTQEEADRLDALRGDVSRSEFLRRAIRAA